MKKVLLVRGGDSKPYEEAMRAAGMEPVVIEPENSPTAARGLLDGVSGLLLMGGEDVNPSRYGEAAHPETDPPNDQRDELEFALIEEALKRDMPLLGICRGLQILNVQQGGTLTQHIDATDRHVRRTPDKGQPAHEVEIAEGTLLAGALSAREANVNSRHHQAIAIPGRRLRVAAIDPTDGTIEAIERPDRRFCLAVQWHPENQASSDEIQRRLFESFAASMI